jgi:hypothetical protein
MMNFDHFTPVSVFIYDILLNSMNNDINFRKAVQQSRENLEFNVLIYFPSCNLWLK